MIIKNCLKSILVGSAISLSLILNTSCISSEVECPNDTYLNLHVSTKNDVVYRRLTESPGKIDSIPFVAWAISGNRKRPLSDLTRLPLDVSAREMMFIIETAKRSDTLNITYDFDRARCESSGKDAFYLSIINLQTKKNTFNDPTSNINCSVSPGIYY